MRLWKVMALIAPLAAALSLAQEPTHAQRRGGPCREDIQKFCASVQPGAGRFRDCLQQHAAKLTPECQQRLSQMKAKVATLGQACDDDVQKLCSGVTPARGGIARCLRQHENELSQACKDQLAQPRRGLGFHRGPRSTPGQ
jgi:hypothetical protein